MKITTSKYYANANVEKNEAYCDYSNYKIEVGDIDNYQIVQKMVRGRYSEVFEGVAGTNAKVVIKVLKPVRITKINREILILKHLEHKNIIRLKDVVLDSSSGIYSLIFDYMRHQESLSFFDKLNLNHIRFYSIQILEALNYTHSKGIIHRDIKPQNMIVDLHSKQLKILDWGLGEFYIPEKEYSVRVASRYYKAPELLVGYSYYDYSLDIWSFGCILAELLLKKRPFFHGMKKSEQTQEVAKVLGVKDLRTFLEKYEISEDILEKVTDMPEERKPLLDFVDKEEYHLVEDGIDLLEKIFVYDHHGRPSAADCLSHRFFD